MEKVFVATGNTGKIEEMKPLFDEKGIELVQIQVDISEIQATDVEDVAERKVRDSRREALDEEIIDENDTLIVEDTGFFIEAIGGFPGAQAAVFDKTAGAGKLLNLIEDEEETEAYFKTAIGVFHDGAVEVFTGKMAGRVPREKQGESHPHLPYNSYFIPEDAENSLAEDQDLKNNEFHRTRAVRKFLGWLESL
ncbi:MAG: non-canonical purine NTP pyrophosphatase [Candidatus Nanohaloarchaea archaeon]